MFLIVISVNDYLAVELPLNPDYINGENNNGNSAVTGDVELFTKKQDAIKQETIKKQNEKNQEINNNFFIDNTPKEDKDIANQLEENNIFSSKNKKVTYKPNPVDENSYNYIIIFIVGFVLCVLTYFVTKKYKNKRKGDKNEYNVYFANK